MCAMAVMLLSGCILTLTNNDNLDSDLVYTVKVEGATVGGGVLPAGESTDIILFTGGHVEVHGAAARDGLQDTYEFDTIPGNRIYSVKWVGGFED